MINNPLITIITVVLNAESSIEKTIQGVTNQTYDNTEYIVIDGGSTDNTVDIIEKYRDKISIFKSEPDKGIFDAMNKGIELASGEWINFMNAGDYFYSNDVIERIFKDKTIEEDFIYGDYIDNFYIGNNVYIKQIPAPEPGQKFWKVFPCHQSSFVRTKYLKKSNFNINDGVEKDKADFAKLLEFYYSRNLKFKKENIIVAYYTGGGFSANNVFEKPEYFSKIKGRKEKYELVKRYINTPDVCFYFIYLVLRDLILITLLKPMPYSLRYRLFVLLKRFNLN